MIIIYNKLQKYILIIVHYRNFQKEHQTNSMLPKNKKQKTKNKKTLCGLRLIVNVRLSLRKRYPG